MKSGFVSLIGRPNVGKSTLMNRLIGQKIAITSNKPQTTRNRIQTVYTDERGQIVFLDTPGIHKAKNKLGEFMADEVKGTFGDADIVMWLVEADPYIGPGDKEIAESLKGVKEPKILVINKVDRIKREELLPIIAKFSELGDFDEIIPVSAEKGDGTRELLETIFKYLGEGPMYYDEETVTEQPMREITAEIIREKALKNLREEIPHGIAVEVTKMSQRKNGLYDIDANIICEKDSHKGIIIGKGGASLKKIGQTARYEIERLTESKVNLKLFVKVRKDWRDNETFLKQFGYTKEK